MIQKVTPEIGMGVTFSCWSDCIPGTIIEIPNPSCIIVQEDKAKRIDENGMSDSQEYEYSPNPKGDILVFTLRKNGGWVQKGKAMRNGYHASLGRREKFHDYSM